MKFALILTVAALLFASACASNEAAPAQTPPPPPSPVASPAPVDSSSPAATPGAVASTTEDSEGTSEGGQKERGPHQRRRKLPPPGPTVHVTLDGKTADVTLSSLVHDGAPAPTIAAVWKAAFPAIDPGPLRFDLVGSDGFKASSRGRCSRLMTGAQIATAHLDPTSHNVSFDPGVELPHCFSILAVVNVDATR